MPLDIGVGILASLFISHTFSVPLTPLMVVVGVLFALLPDIDIVTMAWGKWHHRELTHYPIIYVLLVAVVYYFFGDAYASLLALCVYAHLIHDTIGIGWGVSWLWPLTPRRYLFLPDAYRRHKYGWFMSWLPSEQHLIDSGPVKEHWIRAYYLRPNLLAYIEYSTFAIAVAALVYYW